MLASCETQIRKPMKLLFTRRSFLRSLGKAASAPALAAIVPLQGTTSGPIEGEFRSDVGQVERTDRSVVLVQIEGSGLVVEGTARGFPDQWEMVPGDRVAVLHAGPESMPTVEPFVIPTSRGRIDWDGHWLEIEGTRCRAFNPAVVSAINRAVSAPRPDGYIALIAENAKTGNTAVFGILGLDN